VRLKTLSALLALLATFGCGGGDVTATTYANISGSFAGPVTGTSQGVTMNVTLSVTIIQSGGSLGGSYAISGTLNDGGQVTQVSGTGTLTGTVASGNNPSVNITVDSPACPNYSALFSGAYDTANQRLTITGPIQFLDEHTCNVLLTFQSTIIMSR
jgi:hypothetical protein